MKFNLSINGEKREFEIIDKEGSFNFKLGEKSEVYTIDKLWSKNILIRDSNSKVYNVFIDKHEEGFCVFFKGKSFVIKDATSRKKGGGFDLEGEIVVKSPLPGQIKKVYKKVNNKVEEGESILVLEAMKMENEIKSPKKGVLKKLSIKEGDSVDPQSELFIIE